VKTAIEHIRFIEKNFRGIKKKNSASHGAGHFFFLLIGLIMCVTAYIMCEFCAVQKRR
jgi:hypothetical protein